MSITNDLLDESFIETKINDYNYPLTFEFKIGTLANDFIVKDAEGITVAYVRQKMFKLKEAIQVFTNEQRTKVAYTISADRIIDFNASYSFKNENDEEIGRVGRKGMKSILKANYEVFSENNQKEFQIKEENPWVKVFDSLLGEIPILSMFTGYLFNPKYIVNNSDGTPAVRLTKEPSFFGRKFKLEKLGEINQKDSEKIILSLMMMSLLERKRG